MRKFALATGAFFALASASVMAQDGYFFVNGNLGHSAYSAHYLNGWDQVATQGALRLGYAWQGPVDVGVEAGYADLGRVTRHGAYEYLDHNGDNQYGSYRNALSARGWLLGGNVKYNFDSAWYLSARAGFFEPTIDTKVSSDSANFRSSSTSTRGYAGVGGGYNFSPSWGLGVSYDYYNLGHTVGSANTFSVTAEMRF